MKYCALMQRRPKILVIVGPTASGKSALAVQLARRFGGEIISADSRQVYRGLDVGTGKITKREMRGIRHHLLDVASPKRKFTADDFVRLAKGACSSVLQKTAIPIIVGGTGFYIDALLGRVGLPDVAPNEPLRKRLEKRSAEQLFAELEKSDPRRARTIEPHNKRRLIRALEIVEVLGSVPTTTKVRPLYDALWIGIAPTTADLQKKILKRLRERMAKGMVAEARRLHARGLSYKRMDELGLEYRSLARHLRGLTTKAEMLAELERDIRRYAKKQLAYWKRNSDIRWFKPGDKRISSSVSRWLNE